MSKNHTLSKNSTSEKVKNPRLNAEKKFSLSTSKWSVLQNDADDLQSIR